MWIPVPHTSDTLPALAITTWSPQLTPALLTLLNGTSGTAITNHLRNKIPQPYTQEAADDFLSRVSPPTSLFTSYAIVSHNDGTIVTAIGTIGLTFKDPTDIEAHAAELGYWLAPEYWGKGVMTSVLSAFMKDFVTPLSAINPRCADVPLAKVYAIASLENPGSCMVLEKNGFEREGVLRSTIDENINNNDKTVYNAITFYQKMVPRDPHEINRTATPLELLFDLTLVVSISITSEQFTHLVLEGFNIDLAIFLFFATFSSNWMAWMDFTWFLTAYDPDDVFFRIGTLGQILGILTIGTGVPSAFMFNFIQVLYGFILLRAFYVSFYLGRAAFEDSVNRIYNLRMIFLTTLVQAGWYITSVYGPPTIEWTASTFVVLMFCEFFFPYISEIATPSPGRHPIHLGERYGALTIIVIGESFISLGAAVIDTTTGSISPEACKIAVACVVTLFVMWWTYFTIPFGVLMQTRRNLMRVCGYGHYFLHISIAIAASGTSLMMQTGLYPEKYFFGREVSVQVFAWAVSAYFVFLTLVTGVLLGFCRVFFMGLGIKVGTCAVFLAIAHFGTPHMGTGDTLLIMCIPIILLLCATIWITNMGKFAANTEADVESP